MPSLRARLAVALAAIASFVVTASLVAQPSVIDIGRLGPSFSTLWAVNDLDQAVGWSETAGSDSEHAILWKDGQLIDLGVLPGFTAARALGINDAGLIVGLSYEVSTFHVRAVVWENGPPTDLTGFDNCRAAAVNDDGVIAGSCGSTGLLWHDGEVTVLGGLPAYPNNFPTAINDAGVVVGTLSDGSGRSVPYRWVRGNLTPLALPPGATAGSAAGINARGMIVGTVTTAAGFEPVIWIHGLPTPLGGTWGSVNAQAWGINDRGEVVFNGVSRTTNEGGAFVWRAGRFRVLDPLGVALDINNRGVVVGRRFVESFQEDHGAIWPRALTRVRRPDVGGGGNATSQTSSAP